MGRPFIMLSVSTKFRLVVVVLFINHASSISTLKGIQLTQSPNLDGIRQKHQILKKGFALRKSKIYKLKNHNPLTLAFISLSHIHKHSHDC